MALDHAVEDDCVLIAGKGHESFQEVQYTAIPFDDRIVAGELLTAKQLAS
jgi:UDP-N-acetylmuramoyl-L-alanyl-D-glutamate--2,6-diaminopimelate ligase